MLKWGESCSLDDRGRMVFEDGRRLDFELLPNGVVAITGMIQDDYEGIRMTEPRFVGVGTESPFEIARTISLEVMDRYGQEFEKNRLSTARKKSQEMLYALRAEQLRHSIPGAFAFPEELGVTVQWNGGRVVVDKKGFTINGSFNVPIDLICGAMKLLTQS